MNKQDLINKVFDKTALLKKDCENVINTAFELIVEELAKGDDVLITGFGSFEVKTAKPKRVISLKDHEEIIVPPSKSIKFHCAKKAKDIVNR